MRKYIVTRLIQSWLLLQFALLGVVALVAQLHAASGAVAGAEVGSHSGTELLPGTITTVLEAIARRGDVVSLMAIATSLALGVVVWLTKEHIRSLREQVVSVTKFSIQMSELNERFSRLLTILESRLYLRQESVTLEHLKKQKLSSE